MLKRLMFAAILIALVMAFSAPSQAVPSHSAKFVVGQASYEADGAAKAMDAATFIENSRTYVPVRYFALALGVTEGDIGWDAATRTVTLALEGVNLKMVIGNKALYVDGKAGQMDVSPLIRNGRTYLPARWVAEAFGYEVSWDAGTKTVLVCPPGHVVKPDQPVGYKIDMTAARNGTLQPPAGAVAPPDKWGFEAKAIKAAFKVGVRTAIVTKTDGTTYNLDLGAAPVVVTDKESIDWLKKTFPTVYVPGTYVELPDPNREYWAVYVPFIPVAEAFGVPKENIQWDGQHLAVFGFDGSTKGYIVLQAGSREQIRKWIEGPGAIQDITNGTGALNYPLFVKDGVPMIGINSNDNIGFILFIGGDAAVPAMIRAYSSTDGGWLYETGIAATACKTRA